MTELNGVAFPWFAHSMWDVVSEGESLLMVLMKLTTVMWAAYGEGCRAGKWEQPLGVKNPAHSHRESEFYKQPLEFGRWLWAPWKSYPSWHFDDSLEQGTQISCVQTPDPLKLWSENVCYFQVLNVWWFVTQ